MFPLIEKHYQENHKMLFKRFIFRAGGEENAQDIVQEAYYRAMRYFGSYRPEEDFNRWFSIILNNCLREFKNIEKNHNTIEQLEEDVQCPSFPQHMMRDVYKIIQEKPLVQKEVLMLYFKQEYAAIDISRITEYSYANCHKIIQRFREELKETFKE